MSVRMLRRALQSNPAADPGGDTASSGPSTSDVEADEGGGPVGNPFDLLGLQDEGEDGDSDVERDAHQQNDAASASTSAAVAVSVSRSKRKKGKNKKKGKKDLDTAESIDKLLERMTIGNDGKAVGARNGENLAPGNGEGFYTSSAAASQNGKGGHGNVLMADPKHLRAEDELRRIFGAKVINAVDRQEGVAAQRRRQGVPGRRGGRGLPLKKSMLVVPREDWIRWNSGMSMECIKVEGPIQHFRYIRLDDHPLAVARATRNSLVFLVIPALGKRKKSELTSVLCSVSVVGLMNSVPVGRNSGLECLN